MSKAILHTDGGSRGNPGPAGIGFQLVDKNGELVADGGWFLSHATNNVAEYSALIWGMRNALAAKITHLEAFADSELMVKQMQGIYKVKSVDLQPLHMEAQELVRRFERVEIAHVYREQNKAADALANETMDARGPVGSYVVSWGGSPTSLFDREPDVSDFKEKPTPTPAFRTDLDKNSASPSTAVQDALLEPASSMSSSTDVALEAGFPSALTQGNQERVYGESMETNQLYKGVGRLSGATYEGVGGTYELTVKDHFDAAHGLPGYDGPCQYLHGHTWDVEVTIAGQHLDSVGILYDFKDIKRDIHAILNNFDHHCINDVPPFDRINPTAEHLARIIFFELEHLLPAGISLKEIAIWESPVARVSYRP